MNERSCEQYTEWMSLAQDGMLSGTQTRLLHSHLVACPPCRALWEAMTTVSRMFHASPAVAPIPGFVTRFQARLAYREEQRRRAAICILLGTGVIALVILALPSLTDMLYLTGRLILPYEIFAYMQGLFDWMGIVLEAFVDAVWVLIRYFATQPAARAYIGPAAIAGILALVWTRLLLGRMAAQEIQQDG